MRYLVVLLVLIGCAKPKNDSTITSDIAPVPSPSEVVPAPFVRTERVVHLFGDSIFVGFDDYANPSASAPWSFLRSPVQDPTYIAMYKRDGTIQPQDIIIFENAGPNTGNSKIYRAWLELAAQAGGSQLVLTTTFDYNPTLIDCTYDTKMPPDNISANDIVRSVAKKYKIPVLDWNTEMDNAVALGFPVMQADGIHPTLMGRGVLLHSILTYLGTLK